MGRQVPITYTREMAWATELLRLLPTIGLIGLYIWFTRRQLGGGFGGGGGMGGRGIFNVGKAQARRLRPLVCFDNARKFAQCQTPYLGGTPHSCCQALSCADACSRSCKLGGAFAGS